MQIPALSILCDRQMIHRHAQNVAIDILAVAIYIMIFHALDADLSLLQRHGDLFKYERHAHVPNLHSPIPNTLQQ